MDGEQRARAMLAARAWDLAAVLPESLILAGPLEEVVRRGDLEITVRIRPAGPPPGPPPVEITSLEPVQRFLPGCWLTDTERAVVACLLEEGQRRTLTELREPVEARIGCPVSEGVLRFILARMTDRAVGILDNDRTAHPPGYQVTEAYRRFLAWAALVQGAKQVQVA